MTRLAGRSTARLHLSNNHFGNSPKRHACPGGEVKPSIETAARMADALGVSLDYLTGLSDQELDQDLVKQISELQSLRAEDRQHISQTIGALIRDAKARKAYAH